MVGDFDSGYSSRDSLMADLSALYPQAPQPNQGLLQGDPSSMIQGSSALQDMQIRRAQAPALMQQPAAALAGQNIANTTAQAAQEATMRSTVAAAYASGLQGIQNPNENDIHNLTANISRAYPTIALTRPDIINSTADLALKDPRGIPHGIATITNMATPVGDLVTVNDPNG